MIKGKEILFELAGNSSYPRKSNRGSTLVLIFDALGRLLDVQPAAKQMLKRIKLCLKHFKKEVIIKRLKIAPDSFLSHSQYQVTGPRIGSSAYSNSHGNMTAQKQRFPSFASTISALGIILYCVGFLRVELELNNQRERLQALENIAETEPPSGDLNIAKFIKVTRGMYSFQCKNFMQL